jgi:hypothetical protein
LAGDDVGRRVLADQDVGEQVNAERAVPLALHRRGNVAVEREPVIAVSGPGQVPAEASSDVDLEPVTGERVQALSCEDCKPNRCAVDVRPLFARPIGDESSLVRSMVIHVVTARLFHHQWAVDLVARVAASDKSAKLRESADRCVPSGGIVNWTDARRVVPGRWGFIPR